MKLRRRIAAIIALGLLTMSPVAIALSAGSTPDSVAHDGTIINEN
jgi:hypothetical protein